MRKKKEKDSFSYFKLAVALIFLLNPCIKFVDLLADFVACIIISKMLSGYCDRSEGFTEARDSFVKLGWLSFMKIPAFILAVMIRGKNTIDNDISVLFTLIFAVFEAYMLIVAVKYLFSALFHVGLRGGADATILPFPTLGKGVRVRPEVLKVLSYIFAVVKSAACFLPETLMLSTTEDAYGNPKLFRLKAMYPKIFLIGVFVTLALGLIVFILYMAYFRAIRKEGALKSGIISLHTEGELLEIEEYINAKRLKRKLRFIALTSFFSFDIVIENMANIDIVPDFIFGILITLATCKLLSTKKAKLLLGIPAGLYTLLSLVSFVLTLNFLDSYEYISLVHKAAKDAYLPILNIGIAQCCLLAISIFALCFVLYAFIKKHTGIDVDQRSRVTVKNDRRRLSGILVFGFLGTAIGLCKVIGLFLNYNMSVMEFTVQNRAKDIITSPLPWFNTFSFILNIAFVAYTCYFISCLTDEVDLKYS